MERPNKMNQHWLLNDETKAYLSSFAIYLWGIMMLVIGNQISALTGKFFWFPLGILTLPCVKYGILLILAFRDRKVTRDA